MCLDLILTIFQDVRKRITLSKVTHSTVAEKEKKWSHLFTLCCNDSDTIQGQLDI